MEVHLLSSTNFHGMYRNNFNFTAFMMVLIVISVPPSRDTTSKPGHTLALYTTVNPARQWEDSTSEKRIQIMHFATIE
jgi:hypothetical protein